jgi:hypothetical protein
MKTFLLVAMIVEGLVGIACIGSPQAAFAPSGMEFNPAAVLFGRVFGSAIFALAVVAWFARRSGQPAMMRIATEGLFAYYLVSSLVIIPAQLAGVMNAAGWIIVVLHLGLAAWARSAAARGA